MCSLTEYFKAYLCAYAFTFTIIPRAYSQQYFKHYVALGDSFSSGAGAGPLLQIGPDLGYGCQRSVEAWPYRIASDLGMNDLGKSFTFSACIGMTAKQIRERQILSPDAQFENPDLVSITMGANDMTFLGQFVQKCIQDKNCGRALADARDFVSSSADFEEQMSITLQLAGTHNPPPPPLKRTLLVMGYPAPFNFNTKWNPLNPRIDTLVNQDSRRRIDEIVDIINWKLENAAARSCNTSYYTIWINPNQAFMGRRLAEPDSRQSFIRGFGGILDWKRMLNPTTVGSALTDWRSNFVNGGVLHPNHNGQLLLADLAKSRVFR